MSPLPLKINLPMQSLKKFLRIYAPTSDKSPDDWASQEISTVKVGDIYTIFQPARLFSQSDDMSELELAGVALVFREDAGFPMNYFVDDSTFEMSFMEGVLSAKASEAKENGQAFYCFHTTLSKKLTAESATALGGMHKWGGSGERNKAPQSLPDPLFFFLSSLGVDIDASLSRDALPIADLVLALFNSPQLPAGTKISALDSTFTHLEGMGLEALTAANESSTPAKQEEAKLSELLEKMASVQQPVLETPAATPVVEVPAAAALPEMTAAPAASPDTSAVQSSSAAAPAAPPAPALDDDDDDLDLSKLENALKGLVSSSADLSGSPESKPAGPVGRSNQGTQFDNSDGAWNMLKISPKLCDDDEPYQEKSSSPPASTPEPAAAAPLSEGLDFSAALAAELNAEVTLSLDAGDDFGTDFKADLNADAPALTSSSGLFDEPGSGLLDFGSQLARELNAEVKLGLSDPELPKTSGMEPWPGDFVAAFKAELGGESKVASSADGLEDLLHTPTKDLEKAEENPAASISPAASADAIADILLGKAEPTKAEESTPAQTGANGKIGIISGHLVKDNETAPDLSSMPELLAPAELNPGAAPELQALTEPELTAVQLPSETESAIALAEPTKPKEMAIAPVGGIFAGSEASSKPEPAEPAKKESEAEPAPAAPEAVLAKPEPAEPAKKESEAEPAPAAPEVVLAKAEPAEPAKKESEAEPVPAAPTAVLAKAEPAEPAKKESEAEPAPAASAAVLAKPEPAEPAKKESEAEPAPAAPEVVLAKPEPAEPAKKESEAEPVPAAPEAVLAKPEPAEPAKKESEEEPVPAASAASSSSAAAVTDIEDEDDDESRPQKKLSLQATLVKLEEQSGRANLRLNEFKRVHETACNDDLQSVKQKASAFEQKLIESLLAARQAVIGKLRSLAEENEHKLKAIVSGSKEKIEQYLPESVAELEKVASALETGLLFAELRQAAASFDKICAKRFTVLDAELSPEALLQQELVKLDSWRQGAGKSYSEVGEKILGSVEQHRIAGLSALESCLHSMIEELQRLKSFDLEKIALLNDEFDNKFDKDCQTTEIRLHSSSNSALCDQILPLLSDSRNLLGQKSRQLRKEIEEQLEANSVAAMAEFQPVITLAKQSVTLVVASIDELRTGVVQSEKQRMEEMLAALASYFDGLLEDFRLFLSEHKKSQDTGAASVETEYFSKIEKMGEICLVKIKELNSSAGSELKSASDSSLESWGTRANELCTSVSSELSAELEAAKNHRRESMRKLQEKLNKLSGTVQTIQAQLIQ